MPIEFIPYVKNINETAHVLCVVVRTDTDYSNPKVKELENEGWEIKFITPHTMNNISTLTLREHCFSELTLSKTGIWNMFVTKDFYGKYWHMATRDGRDESEWTPS